MRWVCEYLHSTFPTYDERAHGTVPMCDISKCLWVLADIGTFSELFWDWDIRYFSQCLESFGDVA